MIDYVTLVISLLASLGVGVNTFVMRRQNKALKNAEVVAAENQNVYGLLDRYEKLLVNAEEKNSAKNEKIADLYSQIGEYRRKANEDAIYIATLKIEIAQLQVKVCEIRNCQGREPQNTW